MKFSHIYSAVRRFLFTQKQSKILYPSNKRFRFLGLFYWKIPSYNCINLDRRLAFLCPFHQYIIIMSNFNGSSTFKTMNICSRLGQFNPINLYFKARSRTIILLSLTIFLQNENMSYVLIRLASLGRLLCVHAKYIFNIKYEISNYSKYINTGELQWFEHLLKH